MSEEPKKHGGPVKQVKGLPSTAKPIPGFSGYFADVDGKIYRFYRKKYFIEKTQRLEEEYYRVSMIDDSGKARMMFVHVCILLAHRHKTSLELETRHLDGVSTNNSLSNLAWGTRLENCEDKALHGTAPRGERGGGARLNEDQVRFIKQNADTHTQSEMARMFGVSVATIHRIVRNQKWRHVS